ncbi:MAG: hypothetical protein KH373_05210 [Ruminococcus sp.]|nr:hypothetical protein [Ruminococcus sp.]
MGKHLVCIAGAFAIIIIICAITTSTSRSNYVNDKQLVTKSIDDVEIDNNDVTTNIWDYIKSQKETTIGDSNSASTKQPEFTIVLK